jgi:ParB family chromosome partitioning protein
MLVNVNHIHPNPDNPRFEAGDLTELAASIRVHGVLVPILARIDQNSSYPEFHYIIEDGYRRWAAARTVLEYVPVNVLEMAGQENPKTRALAIGLITDIHKVTLTPMEKAKAFGRLRDEFDMTMAQIANSIGVDTSTVSRYLALLELSDRTQKRVASGSLSVDDAIKAVRIQRAKNRKEAGHKPADVGWEPDHFTKDHHLAKKARTMCDAREHTGRRRIGKIACGQCWETVIRQDEVKVQQVQFQEAGISVPFLPPIMTAGTRKSSGNGVAG